MFETEADRRAFAESWGDVMIVAGRRIPGQYDVPRATELLVEGTSPVFMALASDLSDAGVTVGTTVTRVETHLGESHGPFQVVNIPESEDDGAFLTLGLQVS